MRRSLALVSVSLVAALAVACGGGGTKTVNIPGGGQISTSNKIPSSFPSDFPVYSGASVQGSLTGKDNGLTGVTVTWETGDSVSKVTDFYNSKLKDGNWIASSTGTSGDTAYWIGANKDGSKSMYAGASSANNKTMIIVTIGDSTSSPTADSTDSTSSSSATSTSSDSSGNNSAQKSPTASPLPPEAKLPSGFPTDRVPLPSGARITSASSFSNSGAKTFSVELYIKDTSANAAKYFETELPKHNWTSGFSSESNGEYIATYTSSDPAATSDSVTVSASDSETPGYSKVDLLIAITGA